MTITATVTVDLSKTAIYSVCLPRFRPVA